MRLSTILKYASASLLSNKLRSLLTMLGLIIGIASVILLVGIGQGANQSVSQKMDALGGDILTASVYAENPNDGLKSPDLGELKKLPGIRLLNFSRLKPTLKKTPRSAVSWPEPMTSTWACAI